MKEPYLKDGIKEYARRLKPYTTLRVVEVPDERAPPGVSTRQEEEIRKKEGNHLRKAIPPDAFVITLHPGGEGLSSEEFADRIRTWEIEGPHTIAFLVGGELGLSKEVISTSGYTLSLSQMIFPHQMARLMLLEALYRAFRHLRGEPYCR
ncbi:MAG: 23S rRNA (pseudouridine(1915)-N(3))-methyltransferase RlmH [Methanomicrobiales archaeon]|nr:23S rRNA (pseudouridine(1915)-N(3))-methyltransferase RlmH [Methanomicrobiales archaeon]